MDDDKVHEAKAQVQGQLAAQYIQDVMQARTPIFVARALRGPSPD
jgi:hypothetical protein